jgi:DNA polymerase-3 subunit delta
VKAIKAQLDRAIAAPTKTRLFLLHGADEAGSRAIARRIAAGLGPDAERVELSGTELKSDTARLADEAAAISMFGTARCVVVHPAGDECCAAVESLLGIGAAGNPVVLVAGALKPTSKLLKLAIGDPSALAFESKPLGARDMERLVAELARERGLQVSADVAARLVDAAAANRAVVEQELDKFAAYLDASPQAPKPLDQRALDAVGAALSEGDTWGLMDAVFGGDVGRTDAELARLRSVGAEGITLIRAGLRRATLSVRQGNGSPARTPAQISRLLAAEEEVKRSGGIGPLAADAELIAMARQASRR